MTIIQKIFAEVEKIAPNYKEKLQLGATDKQIA